MEAANVAKKGAAAINFTAATRPGTKETYRVRIAKPPKLLRPRQTLAAPSSA
jgi:hypothetical protein